MSLTDRPARPIKDLKSEYIRNKISKGDYEDENFRSYINALTWLEEYIDGDSIGYPEGMQVEKLKQKYYGDFIEIERELKPERLESSFITALVKSIEKSLEPKKRNVNSIKRELRNRQSWREISKNTGSE